MRHKPARARGHRGVVVIVSALAVGALGHPGWRRLRRPSTGLAAEAEPTATPRPTARPIPGHEVYGYIPYWEMDSGHRQPRGRHRSLDHRPVLGHRPPRRHDQHLGARLQADRRYVGKRLVREAHDRGVRTEVVFSSFGAKRNERFFGGPIETQDAAIDALVAFAKDHSFDGINVDVETLDRSLVPAYGAFVSRLRDRLRSGDARRARYRRRPAPTSSARRWPRRRPRPAPTASS